MSQVSELEQRLSGALARIAATAEKVPALRKAVTDASQQLRGVQSAHSDRDAQLLDLRTALKAAEDQTAQEAQRADAAQAQLASVENAHNLQAEVQELKAALSTLEQSNGQLIASQHALRTQNQALRDMIEASSSDAADAVVASLKSDLDALQTERAAEQAEMAALRAALLGVIGGDDA